MSETRTYLDYLNEKIDISPANSQEELDAAELLGSLMQEHGLEVQMQDFDTPAAGDLPRNVMYVIMFLGMLLVGFLGSVVALVGLLLVGVPFALLVLEYSGRNVLANLGPKARSQNVIGVHRASGPLVVKGNRPIVIVAHYDTPNEGLLYREQFSVFQPLIRRSTFVCTNVVAVCALIQIMGFLPESFRHLLWIVGILASLPSLLVGVAAIYGRFAPCTEGANDNKASVAAMLGVMDKVRPSDDEAKRYMALHPHIEAVPAPEPEGAFDEPEYPGDDDVAVNHYVPRGYDDEPVAEPEPADYPAYVERPQDEVYGASTFGPAPADDYQEIASPQAEAFGGEVLAKEESDDHSVAVDVEADELSVPSYKELLAGRVRRGAEFMQSLNILPEDCQIIYKEPPAPQIDLSDLPEIPEIPDFSSLYAEEDAALAAEGLADQNAASPQPSGFVEYDHEIPEYYEYPEYDEDGLLHYVTYEEQYPFAHYELVQPEPVQVASTGAFEEHSAVGEPTPRAAAADEPIEGTEEDGFAEVTERTELSETTSFLPDAEQSFVASTQDLGTRTESEHESSLEDVPSFEPIASIVPEVPETDELNAVANAFQPSDEAAVPDEPDGATASADGDSAADEPLYAGVPAEYEPIVPELPLMDADGAEQETPAGFDAQETTSFAPVADAAESAPVEVGAADDAAAPVVHPEAAAQVESLYEDAEFETVSDGGEASAGAAPALLDNLKTAWGRLVERFRSPAASAEDREQVERAADAAAPADSDVTEVADTAAEAVADESGDFAVETPTIAEPSTEEAGSGETTAFEPAPSAKAASGAEESEATQTVGFELLPETTHEPSPRSERLGQDIQTMQPAPMPKQDIDPQATIAVSAMTFSSEQDVPEEELATKDVSGLDALSVDGLGIKGVSEEKPNPAPIEDPSWGTSSFRPMPQPNIARRAVLFDLPDPSVTPSDPFVSDPDSTSPTPSTLDNAPVKPIESVAPEHRAEATDEGTRHGERQAIGFVSSADAPLRQSVQAAEKRQKKHFSLFGHKKAEEPESMSDWLGVEQDYDAKKNGRKIGNWDNFKDESEKGRGNWKGGGTTRSGFRVVEGEQNVEPEGAVGYELSSGPEGAGEVQYEYGKQTHSPEDAAAPYDDGYSEPLAESGGEPNDEDVREAILGMNDDELLAHDIWFVAVGASSLDHAGIKNFLAEYRRDVRGAFVVNLDSVGAGDLTILSHEGSAEIRRADRRMGRLLLNIARDMHVALGHRKYNWATTDATPAMKANMRATTIMGTAPSGVPALSHTAEDVAPNIDRAQVATVTELVAELIRRA